MTVSDPLIKELKGWTRNLTESGSEIDDENAHLTPFCECLEKCLQKGVLLRLNGLGLARVSDPWYWLEELANKYQSAILAFSLAIEQTRQNEKVHTPIGRLRFLIRICLTKKCLHLPIEFLSKVPYLALEYYQPNSILGDEILSQIFLSVLLQISKLNFKLNLKNSSFLDVTWQIPKSVALELVPCKNLGISVCFTQEKALIINVDKRSVAAEDDKVTIGDVLDEINGHAITSKVKGGLRKIMRQASGKPVCLHIIKFMQKESQEPYGPIISLIKNTGLENMKKLLTNKNSESQVVTNNHICKSSTKVLNPGFSVKYCGSIHVGTEGDVRQIERAITELLKSGESKQIPVKFECLEIGVRVTQESDETVICKQNYMEISSCGRTINIPGYFAFIAGETNCNVATKFDAYVFHHKNEDEMQIILQSLGQGFQRTHFAV